MGGIQPHLPTQQRGRVPQNSHFWRVYGPVPYTGLSPVGGKTLCIYNIRLGGREDDPGYKQAKKNPKILDLTPSNPIYPRACTWSPTEPVG